jgi:hypothetical protein
MDWENAHVTTQVLWRATFVFAVADALLLSGLGRVVAPQRFRAIRHLLPVTAGAFWFLLWLGLAAVVFWHAVYAYVFPTWSRWLLPPAQALLTGAVAALAVWVAERFARYRVIPFCLVGGLWGSLSHVWAVYRGVMSKPPMLRGASPVAAVIFAFFEFTLYFGVVVVIALAARLGWSRLAGVNRHAEA